jgi:ribosomal protein S18 acetylase RimI-like enzyme
MGASPSATLTFEELNTETSAETLAAARALLLDYGRWVLSQAGAQFCFGTLEKEAQNLPASYLDQSGGCLLAWLDGQPAGFVAWRATPGDVTAGAWEMKRLWVAPTARGHALGRKLAEAVLKRAIAAGRSAVYLDTVPASMGAAHRMYLDLGFEPCAPYNDSPIEGIAWMVKRLGRLSTSD